MYEETWEDREAWEEVGGSWFFVCVGGGVQ